MPGRFEKTVNRKTKQKKLKLIYIMSLINYIHIYIFHLSYVLTYMLLHTFYNVNLDQFLLITLYISFIFLDTFFTDILVIRIHLSCLYILQHTYIFQCAHTRARFSLSEVSINVFHPSGKKRDKYRETLSVTMEN